MLVKNPGPVGASMPITNTLNRRFSFFDNVQEREPEGILHQPYPHPPKHCERTNLVFFQRSRDIMAKAWRNWFCVSVAPDSAKERVMGRTRSRFFEIFNKP
jgi:hypothetical protein